MLKRWLLQKWLAPYSFILQGYIKGQWMTIEDTPLYLILLKAEWKTFDTDLACQCPVKWSVIKKGT